jgi:hypothetical protein
MMRLIVVPALFMLFLSQACRADEGDARIVEFSDPGHPGMLGWRVEFTKATDQPDMGIELFYKYWDPKIGGDRPAKRMMNLVWWRKAPARLSFTVFVDARKSQVVMNGNSRLGRGCLIDATFAVAKEPRRNSDGIYVLCQKPVDPKHPADLGDTQDATAWMGFGFIYPGQNF